MTDRTSYVEVAAALCLEAGASLLETFGGRWDVTHKVDNSVVTAADARSERDTVVAALRAEVAEATVSRARTLLEGGLDTAARRDLLTCVGCHESDATRTCVPCHRVGAGAGNPHPPGFSAGLDPQRHGVCLACHGAGP